MASSLTTSAALRIDAEERLVLCRVPLYSAMAASAECLIYYENKFLTVYDPKLTNKKSIPWTKKDGHIIDMCWHNRKQCVILTKRQFHLLNVETGTVETQHTVSAEDADSTYHRCTSNTKCILLCFSGPGAIIEEWTEKERTNQWKGRISCARDEHICCFRLSSNILGLTLAKPKQGSRFELRQRETMSVLYVISLQFPCYRFDSLNEHTWFLVPYYRAGQEVHVIDTNTRNVRTIILPPSREAYNHNGNYNQMIWNVALMPNNSSRLIVRREKTICFFNIE